MLTTLTKTPDAIDLPANLSIRNISTIAALLQAGLERGVPFALNIQRDAAVDLSFLQLVEAVRRHAEATSVTFTLSRPADTALLATLERSGLLAETIPGLREFWLHEKDTA